jgi:UDP-GlcNAc:undecaprenyl-phosphate/decaprenyl-phosphate GlcNAc-1-phosphate transferase
MQSLLLAQSSFFSADTVLSPYVYVFIAAYLLSFVFTPVMRRVAEFYGVIDKPDLLRKMHSRPVAYLGGVAVFMGWVGGLAVSQFAQLHYWGSDWNSPKYHYAHHVVVSPGIVVAAFMIIALGLWDDIGHLRPRYKIFGQIAAACVLMAFGIGTRSTGPLLSPLFTRFELWFHVTPPEWIITATSCLLILALVVFCCNATNLMDGLDGLCGGVTAIIAAGFLYLAVHLAMVIGPSDVHGSALRIVLALALLGGVMGFIPYNFNPASIFMGDTGSMFLGFSLSLLILTMAEVDTRWLLASLVMFALPVLDTALAIARRVVNKRHVFAPDKQHFHHQLVARGLTVKKAVLTAYALAIAFTLLGALIVFLRTRYAIAAYLVIFGSIIVAAYKMGMVHERPLVIDGGKPLGPGDFISPTHVEAGSVLEIRESEER